MFAIINDTNVTSNHAGKFKDVKRDGTCSYNVLFNVFRRSTQLSDCKRVRTLPPVAQLDLLLVLVHHQTAPHTNFPLSVR